MSLFLRLFSKLANRIHKEISPLTFAKKIGVKFGSGCRFINVDFGTEPYLVVLGNHVSITLSRFITHDGSVWIFRDQYPDADIFAPIKIGNNVFIGIGSTILPGVTIGDNVIIGAYSLVNKDIPSGVVAAGVPAKPIQTIEEHCNKISIKIMHTKHMSPAEKREHLLRLF